MIHVEEAERLFVCEEQRECHPDSCEQLRAAAMFLSDPGEEPP